MIIENLLLWTNLIFVILHVVQYSAKTWRGSYDTVSGVIFFSGISGNTLLHGLHLNLIYPYIDRIKMYPDSMLLVRIRTRVVDKVSSTIVICFYYKMITILDFLKHLILLARTNLCTWSIQEFVMMFLSLPWLLKAFAYHIAGTLGKLKKTEKYAKTDTYF